MHHKINYLGFILLVVLFILAFSIFGIFHIKDKADLPLKLQSVNSHLVVLESNQAYPAISAGDNIIAIDGIHFKSLEEAEVYLDGIKQNTNVKIDFIKNGNEASTSFKLKAYYSDFYLTTASITGFLLILIGMFVLWKKTNNKSARIFNLVTLSTASIVLMTWGNYSIPLTTADYFLHIMFSLCYALAPALFVHFTLSFPREKNIPRFTVPLLYLSAIIMGSFAAFYFVLAINIRSLETIHDYLVIFNISRIYAFVCIITGVIIFIHSYITSQSLLDKKKLRWILLGIVFGPLVFACLWVIPLAITDYGLVPEEFVVTFMLFVPITFAIAILKHHIFDIDLIIKRSVIYFLSFGVLIIFYVAIVIFLSQVTKDVSEYLSAGIAAVIIALLFNPAKQKIQKIIDRKFFRVKYNFRIASRKLSDEIKCCNDIKTLAEKIINQINLLIPVEKQAFFLFSKSKSRVYLEAGYNFERLKDRSIFLDQNKLKTNLSQPVALVDRVEPGSRIEEADEKVFTRWGITLIFPINSNSKALLGFLVLGEKKSERRFTIEDIDLLIEVSVEAGLTIERIQIQEELIKEKVLKEKLRELSELKSFFISSVSHELKTPLTSIKMFSEFLQFNDKITEGEKEEYLEIIQGECDRLGRLIENVLDLSKIERGVMSYHFQHIDIKSLLNHTISLMFYQLKMENCEVITKICESDCEINGDADLIKSAIINLLSNAIKYSSAPKKIFVRLLKDKKSININFENSSNCLSADELLRLSELYYRTENVINSNIPGSGIGLNLVNQIMEAHKGKLLINNIPDDGCRFSLLFPMENLYEKNINS